MINGRILSVHWKLLLLLWFGFIYIVFTHHGQVCPPHLFRPFWKSSVWESASSLLQWIDQKLGIFATVMNIRWTLAWQPRISSNSGRYISVWEEGWIPLKGFMTVWLWCIFEVLRGYFLDASTCAAAGIFSVLMKKKKSWPEALWFMEWKFIHVGRLCMPLRFTSTGWFPVWQQLGQGPKTMPKHSRVISRRIFFWKFFLVFFFFSINRMHKDKRLLTGE